MAHTPFSLNLHTTNNFCSSISNSLYPLLRQPQTHSLYLSNSKAISCSFCCSSSSLSSSSKHTVHVTKNKRKLRPSFFEQIRDKWSVKLPSQRDKFPWQVQEVNDGEEEEGQELEEDVRSPIEVDVSQSENEPVSFSVSNAFVSAPWIQKKKPSDTKVHSKPENLQIGYDDVLGDENTNGFGGDCENKVRDTVVVEEVKKLSQTQVESQPEILQIGSDNRTGDEIIIGFRGNCENNGRDTFVVEEVTITEKEESVKIDAASGLLDKEQAQFGSLDGNISSREKSGRLPWEGTRDLESMGEEKGKEKKSNTELAESMMPEHELRRLRNVALRMYERTKVGAAGITQALVASIHEKWKMDEVVKLKFEEPLSLNMKRTHEILESKTGGLVIWRSGSSVVLFRGMCYKLPCVLSYTKQNQVDRNVLPHSEDVKTHNVGVLDSTRTIESFVANSKNYTKDLSKEEVMDLCELNHVLDELGPRFKDWTGREPLPVDADLLPAVVPGYKPPFRLLPYGVRHCLWDRETTVFRRLARTMPPHFALGRNRELQGLAKAIVKLWESSAIAKIAVKRGVENTRNERMAEELKKLTGGTLLSRNKEYIVFYRGNDFLPPIVREAVKERLNQTILRQDGEELARQTAAAMIESKAKASTSPLVAGTLSETIAATSCWGRQPSSKDVEKMKKDSTLTRQASLVRSLEMKLAFAKRKFRMAEKALGKVQMDLEPADIPTDLETITNEERFLFRKMGLSMKPFLLLGRRGVYDGTIENMHLHWKYRELVKIIVKGKNLAQVKHIAISLEAESGGVLVSTDKTTKGYVIIVYRGKNYRRPQALRPENLLTKRQALARSIELQRREALKHHILDLQEKLESSKSELEQMKTSETIKAENTFYAVADDAYLSSDQIEEAERRKSSNT